MQNFGAKKTDLGKFRGKIEILSTHNVLCREFAVSVGKLQLPAAQLFAGYEQARLVIAHCAGADSTMTRT